MRVFGIDCGTEYTGWGVVQVEETPRERRLLPIAAGAIKLDKKQRTPQRLLQVYVELTDLLAHYAPDCVAIEDVFFAANAKSALKLGHVRGVAMLAAASANLPISEYAPLSIKSAVVGYGLAAKEQVQFMVARLLDLEKARNRRTPLTRSPSPSATSIPRRRKSGSARDEAATGARCAAPHAAAFCPKSVPAHHELRSHAADRASLDPLDS